MLGIVLLWIVVYLSGTFLCKICGEKETSQMWKHLIGFFFLVFCQGCVFFGAQLVGWNFRKAVMVLLVAFLIATVISVIFCRKEIFADLGKIKNFSIKNIKYPRYFALLVWLFLGIVLVVALGTVTNRTDAVVETTITTLLTDTMNKYHPFTRRPLEMGVIMSRKIITLPFWYGALSLWTGLDGVTSVWVLGTLITAVYSLLAYGELGSLLFFRDFKKTWLLVVLMELLYLSGDYYAYSAGYRQLFYGYSGEVIVATVIIPSVLTVLYRFFGPLLREDFPMEREKIKLYGMVLEVGLCIGCCFFLVPMVWGVFMVIIAMALFALSMLGVHLTKRRRGEKV